MASARQDCARSGTTTLRRSSGGVGWFSCMEADRLLSEQFGGTQLVIIVGVEFCENDVEI